MSTYPRQLKKQAESALCDSRYDFIATYHAVNDLRQLARHHTGILDALTLAAVAELLQTEAFDGFRQAYVLFREAASILTDLAMSPGNNGMGTAALSVLQHLLLKTRGSAHRGVAEALGNLPVTIKGPPTPQHSCSPPAAIAWHRLVTLSGLTPIGGPRYIGRSLVVKTRHPHRWLVVKLAKKTDVTTDLENEIGWMETLNQADAAAGCRFDIPAPIHVHGHALFRLKDLPLAPPETIERHPHSIAIAFVAHRDYFVYPNHPDIDAVTAREALGRNAYLLGWMAAKGVIHMAPIPLFHNRTQRLRRDDQGRYQWFRAGRLDQWLDSCAYPNLGVSGVRDFEHLESFSGDSQALYRHIGTHLMSLLLVAGSYFRNRDKTRIGVDLHGQPVKTGDLFDPSLLSAMVQDIFTSYYRGFAGNSPPDALPVDLDRLTRRMIAEMGVDRYMTELLRCADQVHLSDTEWVAFLKQKGYCDDQLTKVVRGERDLWFSSGPHLGDFNAKICLPELTESVAAMAAVCMAARFKTDAQPAD